MEGDERKKINVKFVGDEDVSSIYVELQALPVIKKGKRTVVNNLESTQEETTLLLPNKSSCLFESGDVSGQEIFGFQTPKRRYVMTNKGEKTPKTSLHVKSQSPLQHTPAAPASAKGRRTKCVQSSPLSCKLLGKEFSSLSQNNSLLRKVHGTPKACKKLHSIDEGQKENSVCPMTPYNLRRRFKKKLAAVCADEESFSDGSDVEDFRDSGSDWGGSSVSNGPGSDSQGEGDSPVRAAKAQLLPRATARATALGPSQSRSLKLNFVPSAEEYFHSHASKKIVTSNHTLGKLRHNLPQEKLQKLLSETSSLHKIQLQKLEKDACVLFSKWHFMLREGFNILLYGMGSKQKLLNTFHQEIKEPSVVVNGFFPSLTIQEIVSSIAEDLLGLHRPLVDLLETVDYIKNEFSVRRDAHLFLVVHNIDGVMLRNYKHQEVLALLAGAPNIHLIATVDHISAPFMWDQNMLSMFNFSWWDTTTFQPYAVETAFESSLLIQQSGNLALSSLQNVFRSLTSNAKSIFLLMAEYQKEHKNESNYSGIPFKKLYTLCRDSLLVSSDLALRSQLTEFLDHRLVKSRRGLDGSELLTIPMDGTLVDQFVQQQSAF